MAMNQHSEVAPATTTDPYQALLMLQASAASSAATSDPYQVPPRCSPESFSILVRCACRMVPCSYDIEILCDLRPLISFASFVVWFHFLIVWSKVFARDAS